MQQRLLPCRSQEPAVDTSAWPRRALAECRKAAAVAHLAQQLPSRVRNHGGTCRRCRAGG